MLFAELIVKGLVYGCMYAMMAVGLTLVYGLLRILHIAHAGVFALGAYMVVTVANATGNLALGFLVAAAVSGLAGIAIYRLAYQPILQHSAFVPMVVSIGLFIVMQEGFRMIFGAYGIAFDKNPWYVANVSFAGISVTYVELAMVIVSVLLWKQTRALSLTGLALSLILGGAVGNLWDRVASGRVVDFLLLYFKQYQWPVFNLADSAIVVGAALLVEVAARGN